MIRRDALCIGARHPLSEIGQPQTMTGSPRPRRLVGCTAAVIIVVELATAGCADRRFAGVLEA